MKQKKQEELEERFELFYFQNEEPCPWMMGLSKEKVLEFVKQERSQAYQEGIEPGEKKYKKRILLGNIRTGC